MIIICSFISFPLTILKYSRKKLRTLLFAHRPLYGCDTNLSRPSIIDFDGQFTRRKFKQNRISRHPPLVSRPYFKKFSLKLFQFNITIIDYFKW